MEFGMLGGRPKDPEKNFGTRKRANKRLNPHVMLGLGIETGPTVVGGERCHLCTVGR